MIRDGEMDLTLEELSNSMIHFENFLDKSRLCYYRNFGSLARNVRTNSDILYSIFFSVEDRVEKFNILFSPQSSFLKIKKPSHKYIFVHLARIESNYSVQESFNTLYCAYSVEEDEMVFKPLIWMLNYYKAIMKKIGHNDIKGTNKIHPIRIDTEPRKQKISEKNQYSSASIRSTARAYPEGYGYNIGIRNVIPIYYKKLYIINEDEMNGFFSEHSSYPSTWKLNFKVAINLLTEGDSM